MALKHKLDIDSEEFALGVAFCDRVLIAYTFWAKALTLEKHDEPELSFEQKLMYCDLSPRILMCTGRKTSKSVLLASEIIRLSIAHDNKGSTVEAMVVAPRQKDLNLLYTRIVERIRDDPLLWTLVKKEIRGDAPEFWIRNNLVWYWRIEGQIGDDSNMRGLRAVYIIGDEMEGGNWVCHNSRKMSALPDCRFIYAGVPPVNGERGTPFYSLDQTGAGKGWSRWKFPTYINPLFQTDERRHELEKDFGGRNSQGYMTQVLGEWGDEAVSSFPPGTIAIKSNLPIFVKEYSRDRIYPYAITQSLGMVLGDIPTVRCHSFVIGVDYGATNDPTVLTTFYRTRPGGEWLQYCRLTFNSVEFPHLIDCIKYIISHTFIGKFAGFCTDLKALTQQLMSDFKDTELVQRIWDANPAGTSVEYDDNRQPVRDSAGIVLRIRNKQYFHESLRRMMTNALLGLEGQKLWLGMDDDLVEELRGTTEKLTQGGYTVYHSSEQSKGYDLDHRRESVTYCVAAILNASMLDDIGSTEEEMLAAMGFSGEKLGAAQEEPRHTSEYLLPYLSNL